MVSDMRAKIIQNLTLGRTDIYGFKVKIDTGGIGGRYRAFIDTPNHNVMVQTPDTVPKEGPLTFYDRIAEKIIEIIQTEG